VQVSGGAATGSLAFVLGPVQAHGGADALGQGLCRHLVMLMPAPLQWCQSLCRHLVVRLPAPLQLRQDLCRHMVVLMPRSAGWHGTGAQVHW
jgi:hypothetical protein